MSPISTKVSGVTLHLLDRFSERRGVLLFTEVGRNLPFSVKRIFFVYQVPANEVRGGHAHLTCHQFFVCVKGQVEVSLSDGQNREHFHLNESNIGIYVPPMIWGEQRNYSRDAVLAVFASDLYDRNDYVNHYSDFLNLKGM
jgi:UDP-2-acetamido-3-amino-2,3-dideoxy-glucuronate N-acetyltransferase